MLQAPSFHSPPFEFFPFEQDSLAAPGIDIGRGEVVQALVIALMVVISDEGVDLRASISQKLTRSWHQSRERVHGNQA